jgi:hypothetical protein
VGTSPRVIGRWAMGHGRHDLALEEQSFPGVASRFAYNGPKGDHVMHSNPKRPVPGSFDPEPAGRAFIGQPPSQLGETRKLLGVPNVRPSVRHAGGALPGHDALAAKRRPEP